MPGIVGIIGRQSPAQARRDLRAMIESIRHEEDYTCGEYINEDLGLYLGWASHPTPAAKSLPLVSPDTQRILVIAGDIFSHPHPSSGPNRRDEGKDFIQLYDNLGDQFFDRLNGWFCGIAVDIGARKITLFNDRYAMGRVYIHEGSDEFIFGSEAKAILKVRPQLRTIDPAALAQLLRFNCVMGNNTLFKGISLLPAASAWSFTGSASPRKTRYFSFAAWEEQPILEPQQFHEQFKAAISDVLPAYLEGQTPVGLSLTAGLDTRTILASMPGQQNLTCYTFGGPWGETFDIRTARKLAGMCHLPHETCKIDDNFFQKFPVYAAKSVYLSDGTHDVLGAHDVYFNEFARRIAPIRLTGKFGSEVVRVRRLIPSGSFPRDFVQPSFLPYLDEAPLFETVSKSRHPLSRVVSEEIPWYEYGRLAVEMSKVRLRTPYLDNRMVRLMYQSPLELRVSRDLQARYIKEQNPALSAIPTDLGNIVYGNRIASLAAFLPLWALFKSEYIYLYAMPHWLTRVDRTLSWLKPERLIAGRQKFEGYRIWIKTHLAEFVRDTLTSQARCIEFFDKVSIQKVVARHLAGTHNYMREINKMLTVELIYSTLLHQQSASTRSSRSNQEPEHLFDRDSQVSA